MNEIVSKSLLAGDKYLPERYLNQPGFTYNACGLFTKNQEGIKKFKETGDTKYIYRNKLDKICFQHNMAHEDFKELTRRTASNKVLRDKAFSIDKTPKYDAYQRGLSSMVYNLFGKMSALLTDKSVKRGGVNNEIKKNEELAEELHRTINKKI